MPGFFVPNLQDAKSCAGDGVLNSTLFDGPPFDRETARSHRYLLEVFEPMSPDRTDSVLMFLNRCTRPTSEFDEIPVHHGHDVVYKPGKNHPSPVEFTFYEVLNDDLNRNTTAQLIYKWRNLVLDAATSILGSQVNYLRKAKLSLLNGVGSRIWSYSLYDCWPVKVTPSEMSYMESKLSEITVSLRYSKAIED